MSRVLLSCAQSILAVIVSWNPPVTTCKGKPLSTPISHYELQVFEMRVIGWTTGPDGRPMPLYSRSWSRTTTNWSVNLEPPVGGLVSWPGMWSSSWVLQPPIVVAVSAAGNRSDKPCT